MKKTLAVLLQFVMLAMFLGAGVWLGANARAAYAQLFPSPAFTTGNFSGVFQETAKPVVIFTSSTCQYCKRARELLRRRGVAFHDFVIDQSPDADRRFLELGGHSVPMLLIGERKIVGYRKDTIVESLRLLDGEPAPPTSPHRS